MQLNFPFARSSLPPIEEEVSNDLGESPDLDGGGVEPGAGVVEQQERRQDEEAHQEAHAPAEVDDLVVLSDDSEHELPAGGGAPAASVVDAGSRASPPAERKSLPGDSPLASRDRRPDARPKQELIVIESSSSEAGEQRTGGPSVAGGERRRAANKSVGSAAKSSAVVVISSSSSEGGGGLVPPALGASSDRHPKTPSASPSPPCTPFSSKAFGKASARRSASSRVKKEPVGSPGFFGLLEQERGSSGNKAVASSSVDVLPPAASSPPSGSDLLHRPRGKAKAAAAKAPAAKKNPKQPRAKNKRKRRVILSDDDSGNSQPGSNLPAAKRTKRQRRPSSSGGRGLMTPSQGSKRGPPSENPSENPVDPIEDDDGFPAKLGAAASSAAAAPAKLVGGGAAASSKAAGGNKTSLSSAKLSSASKNGANSSVLSSAASSANNKSLLSSKNSASKNSASKNPLSKPHQLALLEGGEAEAQLHRNELLQKMLKRTAKNRRRKLCLLTTGFDETNKLTAAEVKGLEELGAHFSPDNQWYPDCDICIVGGNGGEFVRTIKVGVCCGAMLTPTCSTDSWRVDPSHILVCGTSVARPVARGLFGFLISGS